MSPQSRIRSSWEHLRHTPGVARNVLVLAAAILITLVVGGYMMSKASFELPFGRQVIRAEFSSAPGTSNSAVHKATIAGVEVGTITHTEPTDRGTAIVEMNIDGDTPIYDNARAVLRTINALNEMYVEISPGGPPGRPLEDGAAIPLGQTERPIQADEVLAHLDEKSQKGLNTLLSESDVALARAPQNLPGGLSATDGTLVNLRPVAENLQKRRDLLAQVVSSLSRITTAVGGDQERTARLANSTEQALGVLADNDKDLRAGLDQLPGLNDGLRNALSSTQNLTDQLDPTLRELTAASKELPPALQRTRSTAVELGKTARAAQPVVRSARPLVNDLRPLVNDVDDALGDTIPVTNTLDNTTKVVTTYLTDLQGFVYNTSSVFGISDGARSFIRAYATQPVNPEPAKQPRKENGRFVGEVRQPGGNQ